MMKMLFGHIYSLKELFVIFKLKITYKANGLWWLSSQMHNKISHEKLASRQYYTLLVYIRGYLIEMLQFWSFLKTKMEWNLILKCTK